jgi:hypothetical protein
MSYLITALVVTLYLLVYDYFLYKRIAYLDARILELDIKFSNICSELNKKIEDHKLETRRIA